LVVFIYVILQGFVMLSVIMLIVVTLSAIMLNVVMLGVVAPKGESHHLPTCSVAV
jgi:hypothetical protein